MIYTGPLPTSPAHPAVSTPPALAPCVSHSRSHRRYGTARIRGMLVDASFERVYATCRVTAHPVDPKRFDGLQKMRKLREDG